MGAEQCMEVKAFVAERVKAWEPVCRDVAKKIWEQPELKFEEHFACGLQAEILEKNGFHIKKIPELETAFSAEYGSGHPIIGIAGEYDALPGLHQDPVSYRSSNKPESPGHGCGHNLIGAGGMLAALAVRDAIEKGMLKGTVRYYGCPAEEGGGGKIFMIQKGAFDDVDCALHWHPESTNKIIKNIFLAKCNLILSFEGHHSVTTVRAGMAGDASQALELVNIGVQYLRKYFDKSMVEGHYVRLGAATHNVLPPRTEILYGLRADNKELLDLLVRRVKEIGEGAAKMTGTKVECEILEPYDSELYLETLGDLIYKNMQDTARPEYEQADLEFAAALSETLNPRLERSVKELYDIQAEDMRGTMHVGVIKSNKPGHRPSSDFANVTRIVPGGMFFSAIAPIGFPMHCWQTTSCTGTELGMKGMVYASKVLAATICDLMDNPSCLQAVREEFEQKRRSAR